jgi:anthranilate phosphoribosyltransferase
VISPAAEEMTNSIALIEKAEAGTTFTRAEAESIMEELLSGRVETSAIVRLLTALNLRPVSVAELAGFASTMRRHAAPVFAPGDPRPENLVDTCGTGGDASGTFNISTAAAFVAAAAGARVAKHGNRSASSLTGSADVLEALGIRIDVPMCRAGQAIRQVGIGFLFAPVAHAAARHAVPARKQIGKRTVFNLLGPLTNPAGADRQVLGVFAQEALDLVAATLLELGVKRAFVVHGSGLDEISLAGETSITEVRDGRIRSFVTTPEEFGVAPAPLDALRGGTPHENAELIRRIFEGQPGAPRDVVIVNAAAALVVAGIAEDFRSGAQLAVQAIDSGAALAKLQQLKTFVNTSSDG